ncbi:MAG: glutathione transferase [Deltaproteobacteria bacterium]|nr:glutathione transferase [Deltaproteobacteria bacterium]MDQ3299994.1 glutathione transferase [Myxococcota bacterium]
MAELKLYTDASWMSPWSFHAIVALEEKRLTYKIETVKFPIPPNQKAELQGRALLGKIPILVHGDLWLSESLAISEYLAESFPAPAYPRLFPAHLGDRARARQVMSYVRTSLGALREDRPTSGVFGRAVEKPLGDKAKLDAADLLRVANALVEPGKTSMFAEWCIADADLALSLMRLIGHEDPVPQHLIDYAMAQWDRRSVRRYIAHLPTRS